MVGIIAGQQAAAARVTSADAVTALHEAIGVISSVCDYAQSYDAQGFNAADAWLGHVLAQMPVALWTDDAALVLNGAKDSHGLGQFAAFIVPTGNGDEAAWSAAAPRR